MRLRLIAPYGFSMLIGLISDTHGLLRPEALAALRGSDLILHAGDIGTPEVLDRLRELAPTFAVRGNNDTQAWAEALPARETVEADGVPICMVSQVAHLFREPVAPGCAAVVFGHTHQPAIETRKGLLYVNPGSAGPRRFTLPVTVARLRVAGRELRPEIVTLNA
jgi:putative phosphoesterase